MKPAAGMAAARHQRRYRRLTLRVEVELETDAGTTAALATTLAAGGLFVATDAPLAYGTRLRVRFRLPGADAPLALDARVVWCEPPGAGARSPGMGLEFGDAGARADLAARLEAWLG